MTKHNANTAAILDLENLLYDSRRVSPSAAQTHLRATWRYLASRGSITWAIGACDYWLTQQTMLAAQDLHIRVRPNAIAKNAADRILCRRGLDAPASVGTVVLVSGDSDLLPLVTALQRRGTRVIVACEPRKVSAVLRSAADDYWPLATWAMLDVHALAA